MFIPPCRVVELVVPVASVNLLHLGAVELFRAEGMPVAEAFWLEEEGWGAQADSVAAPVVVLEAVGLQLLPVLVPVSGQS